MARQFIQYLCGTLGEGIDSRVGARLGLAASHFANENRVQLKTMKAAAVIAAGASASTMATDNPALPRAAAKVMPTMPPPTIATSAVRSG